MGSLNGKPTNGHDAVDAPTVSVAIHQPVAVWPPVDDAWPEAPTSEHDLERPRLEAEIAAAKARAAAARHRVAERDDDIRAALRAELRASQEGLARMEREHDDAVERVLRDAQTEADRIVARARQQLSASSGGTTTVEPSQVPRAE